MLHMYYENIEIDIHGMTEVEALVYLKNAIDGLEDKVTEVSVVHGYRGGDVLQKMVRNKFTHPRVVRKIRTFNPGETVFEICSKQEAKKRK